MATILLIDDSSTDVYHQQKILEQSGYRVITATTAQDGIDKAKLAKPDVILMDIVMPGMNGFQATRQISKDPETAAIPVIMVTNKDQDSDRAWGLRQGAKEYFVKGTPENELIEKIRAIVGE